jgi:ABC-2 type transport system permease protein
MTGYRELLEKEIVEAWRTYRVIGVAAVFVVVGILAAVGTRYLPAVVRSFAPPDYEIGLPPATVADVAAQLVRVLGLAGAVIAILVTMAAVAGERERGTAAFVLVKPVTRAAFLVAKWVAVGMQLGLGVGLAVLAAWLYTSLLIEPLPIVPWVQLALVAWLAAMVHVSITLVGSVVLPTPLAAAGFGVLGLVALTFASAAPTLSPWLPSGLGDVALSVALGESSIDLDPTRTITMSILFVGACLAVAWLWFRRQEI